MSTMAEGTKGKRGRAVQRESRGERKAKGGAGEHRGGREEGVRERGGGGGEQRRKSCF